MNREFKFELEKVEENGEFWGTAAVYNNIDLGSDVIRPGAFTKTIQENGGRVPVLLDHRIPIGIATIEDSPIGLKTHAVLNMEKEIVRDAYSDLKFYKNNGRPYGMSIGYDAIVKDRENNIRILKEVRLHEVSVTITPMNLEARVSHVKQYTDESFAEFLAALKESKANDPAKFLLLSQEFNDLVVLNGTSAPEAAKRITTEPGPEPLHSVLQLISTFKL